jgi:hypothetical protein
MSGTGLLKEQMMRRSISSPPHVATTARLIGRASDGGSEGTARADPKAIAGFPTKVCESK